MLLNIEQKSDSSKQSSDAKGPEILVTLKQASGNVLVALTETKRIKATHGRVYAKSYLLPHIFDPKLMSEIQKKFSAALKTEHLKAKANLTFVTVMSVSTEFLLIMKLC